MDLSKLYHDDNVGAQSAGGFSGVRWADDIDGVTNKERLKPSSLAVDDDDKHTYKNQEKINKKSCARFGLVVSMQKNR